MAKSSVRNGQRRVDPLAAIFNRQNLIGRIKQARSAGKNRNIRGRAET